MCILEISAAYLLEAPVATAPAPPAGKAGRRAAMGPQLGQHHVWDSLARARRWAAGMSSAPTAPSPLVGMKLTSASKIRRMPQAGSHVSGWYAEMLRQTFILVSNRPLGVSRMMDGGRKGYSVGSRMRPW